MSRRSGKRHFERRDALHQWTMRFGPNMTPMVDIVLVILIFFMATAAFVGERWFLPAAITEQAKSQAKGPISSAFELPQATIDITLESDQQQMTRASSTYLGLQRESLERLVARIGELSEAEVNDNPQAIVKPSGFVPYRDIIQVNEALVAKRIVNISMAVTGGQ